MRADDEHASGRDATGRYVAGHANEGGRPRGARVKLSEKFWADVHAEWLRRGATVLEELKPIELAKLGARASPAQLQIDMHGSQFADLPQHIYGALLSLAEFIGKYPGALSRLEGAIEAERRGEPVTVEGVVIQPRKEEPMQMKWSVDEMEREIEARGKPAHHAGNGKAE